MINISATRYSYNHRIIKQYNISNHTSSRYYHVGYPLSLVLASISNIHTIRSDVWTVNEPVLLLAYFMPAKGQVHQLFIMVLKNKLKNIQGTIMSIMMTQCKLYLASIHDCWQELSMHDFISVIQIELQRPQ